MNRGICNACGKLVPCTSQPRDGSVYLVKNCPDCGPTETLISSDVGRYQRKHKMDRGSDQKGCALGCTRCSVPRKPDVVFVDITNRCNLNCPICINNTPSMGFLFEPPLEYFEKIFEQLSKQDPPPYVYLFGGEPTVRKDLGDILRLGKSHGLAARMVTNGVRFADEDFTREVLNVRRRMVFQFAYDGDNPELYKELRGGEKMLELKQKGIDNIGRISEGQAKIIVMCLVAKGYNDGEIGRLFEFCHERRDFIRGVFFIPLAHTWKEGDINVSPERTTAEDIENSVSKVFPDVPVEFLPAGLLSQFKSICTHLDIKPQFFTGVHPNCESSYILFSDGEKYQPIEHFVRGPMPEFIEALFAADARMERRAKFLTETWFGRLLGKIGLQKRALKLAAMNVVFLVCLRHLRIGRMFKGSGLSKIWHVLMLNIEFTVGCRTPGVLKRHTNVQKDLHLIVLPFEDRETLETDRLQRCASAFAYYDPELDQVKTICVCAWSHTKKTNVLRKISEHYGQVSERPECENVMAGKAVPDPAESVGEQGLGACCHNKSI